MLSLIIGQKTIVLRPTVPLWRSFILQVIRLQNDPTNYCVLYAVVSIANRRQRYRRDRQAAREGINPIKVRQTDRGQTEEINKHRSVKCTVWQGQSNQYCTNPLNSSPPSALLYTNTSGEFQVTRQRTHWWQETLSPIHRGCALGQ